MNSGNWPSQLESLGKVLWGKVVRLGKRTGEWCLDPQDSLHGHSCSLLMGNVWSQLEDNRRPFRESR